MKARYTTRNGQVQFEVDGATAKDVFRELASIQEVFDAETKCGCCGSADIRFLARVVEKFDFYELACQNQDCRARFAFGQSLDKVSLFPKRRDADGHNLNNGGWSIYRPEGAAAPTPAAVAPDPVSTRASAAPAARTSSAKPMDTPEGLQPCFDRLAEIFMWKLSPTKLGPALDQLRDEFAAKAGGVGTERFDVIYRNYERSQNKGTTARCKQLMADCVTAFDTLPVRAVA